MSRVLGSSRAALTQRLRDGLCTGGTRPAEYGRRPISARLRSPTPPIRKALGDPRARVSDAAGTARPPRLRVYKRAVSRAEHFQAQLTNSTTTPASLWVRGGGNAPPRLSRRHVPSCFSPHVGPARTMEAAVSVLDSRSPPLTSEMLYGFHR